LWVPCYVLALAYLVHYVLLVDTATIERNGRMPSKSWAGRQWALLLDGTSRLVPLICLFLGTVGFAYASDNGAVIFFFGPAIVIAWIAVTDFHPLPTRALIVDRLWFITIVIVTCLLPLALYVVALHVVKVEPLVALERASQSYYFDATVGAFAIAICALVYFRQIRRASQLIWMWPAVLIGSLFSIALFAVFSAPIEPCNKPDQDLVEVS
jgi:hypothetical protein